MFVRITNLCKKNYEQHPIYRDAGMKVYDDLKDTLIKGEICAICRGFGHESNTCTSITQLPKILQAAGHFARA